MSKRMNPIEKLAREICWAGFTTKEGRKGKTKARYWRTLPSDTRQDYVRDARWFAFMMRRVSVKVLNELTPDQP